VSIASSIESSRPSPKATPPEVPSFSFLELLTTLAFQKRLILGWTLGMGLFGAFLSFAFRPEFTASTTLLPPQQNGSSSMALVAQLGAAGGALNALGGGSLGLKSPQDMYVSLMKSERVEDAVIRQFRLNQVFHESHLSVTRQRLEKKIKIDGSGKDGFIRVDVTDTDPVRAAAIANAYVEEYRKFSSQLAISEAGQRRLFFEQQLFNAKENLGKAEENLKQTEQTTGLVGMDIQARALIQSAATLKAQIAAKEVQIASMKAYASSGNFDLEQAEQELAALRTQLLKLGGNSSGDDLIPSKGNLPQAGLDYLRNLREVKYQETLFEILSRQYEAAKLDEAKEGAPIQVIDAAAIPDRKSFPPRPLFALVGLLAGALGSCLWVTLKAGLADDPETSARWFAFKQALLPRKR
jgi:tyrosine-protein kinase Etk/Wzc